MGWLDKYDDAIIAQGGKNIPISREDYLRQQYQNYLKSQAEKGRKAVVEGREKFAKDYVIPAIKTAGSFTPAGPLIGLADAYNAYQEGNTGWAIAGAGLEALPYAGKIVGKFAPIVKTVSKNLKKDNLKTLIYNNISPVGYTGKKQEIKNLIRDIKYIDNPTIHDNPIRSEIVSGPHSNDFYGLDPELANRNRNDAWKLYLGIDDKGKSLYIPTNKKDVYRYNPNRISDEATHNFLNQRFDEGQDLLTSNAGGVGRIKTVPSNLPDVQFAKMKDTWDLQPFKDASRSLLSDLPYSDKFIFNPDRVSYRKWVPDKLKNLEIGEFLGVGKPFTVEHSIPYKTSLSYTKHPNRNWWEQFGENIDTPKFTRNRVTDRIVYEKPDYDELIKDIYNKKFDKTFQKGGTIKEPTLHTFKLGGEIKSYDNSLNRNIDRFIGKVKSKVPKNFWVLPGMSDIDDVLYLKQAFSDQGSTLDKIIAIVGLSFPYVSTKALKALPIAKRNFPYKQVQETSEELQKRGAPAAYAYAVAEGNWDKPLISIGDNTFYRGVHLPVVPGGKYADDRLTTPLRPSDVDISSQGFRKMEEYAIDPDLPRLQGIDEQNIASGNYYHNGLWTSGTKSIADQYAKVGRFKVNYNQWADKIFKDPNSTKVVYRETPKDIGNLPVGIVQNFKPSKSSLVGIDANDNVRNMISKFYGRPASEISLQEGRDFLNRARIDFTRFNRPFEDGYHFLPGRITPTNNKFIYDQGGIIPKAQEGKKVKKSVIFAESPKIQEGQSQYNILDYDSQLPPSLNNIREKYKDLRKRADELYSTTVSHRNYLINYLKGYTGKDVYSVNSDNTYYARDDDGYGITYSTEEFKDLPPLKKYNELQKELDENYYPSLIALENEFRDHPDNPVVGDKMVDSTFQVEGNKLKSWYKAKGEELDVIPIYGLQDTSKVNAALKDIDLQDVGIMGHSGRNMGGIPLEWWNDKLKDTEYRNCVLGSCYGDKLLPLLPDVKNIYHTTENQWYGVNPSADSLENALFSTQEETKIKPIKGRDYNISNKYKTGGIISKAQEGGELERPYIAKQDATKVLLPLTKKVNQEEQKYYHPEVEDITIGYPLQVALYKNQWLFDTPIIGNIIKKKAKEYATNSGGAEFITKDEPKSSYNGTYSGNSKVNLVNQYFNKSEGLSKSKYFPKSDYLSFLPSYSLKDQNIEGVINKEQMIDLIRAELYPKSNPHYNTDLPLDFDKDENYQDFIKNKTTLYNSRVMPSTAEKLLGLNLAGHKTGMSWDRSIDLPYTSVSDAWDFEPTSYSKKWGDSKDNDEGLRQLTLVQSTLLHKAGNPFKIYDRFYFDPKTQEYISDDSIQSLKNKKGITPLKDEFLNKDISKYFTEEEESLKKFAEGGNVSYTPEYIEQLKRFENRPDNLAYHLDNKKIPTIGWGHRITEEELKRKAIKMGKEWIPYERFSGKEGRILADKLMEQDVSHHYTRLERQVGKDTLSTLPPEVQDVLLDITYNRGSLGDSLEYVKKGDIAGLRDYLAETSKGLKGGAKTRMEWRANRIPLKTLPPVERPIEYNTKDQYVPEVLRSIAEQPSTQSIIPIQDNEGYRNQENYGKPVQITSNQSTTPISMQDVPFPILAMSDTGELKIMMPGEEHEFEGGSVTELPMAQQGDIIKSNQLRTFTKDSGWLNKYKEL